MSFGPVELRFLRDVIVDLRQRRAGDVVVLEHALASSLIEHGYAVPVGGEPVPELRPIVGRFVPRARR